MVFLSLQLGTLNLGVLENARGFLKNFQEAEIHRFNNFSNFLKNHVSNSGQEKMTCNFLCYLTVQKTKYFSFTQ